MSPRPEISVESAKSAVRVAVSRALAEAVVSGFDNAHEEGRELTMLQQTDVLQQAFGAYTDAVKAAEESLDTELILMGIVERERLA